MPWIVPSLAASVYFYAITFFIVYHPSMPKDEMYQDPCFEDLTHSNYPLLPLITVKHKNYIWYDVGPTCQVCCLSQGSVDVYYRYYDPLMTNNVTLYQEVFGNPVHVPFTATKSHHSGIGNLYKIVFSRYQYQPGFYELRITNRYGSTRVKFNILYSDAGSTNPGCTNPLKCKLGRSVRDTKAMAPQPIMNELESKFNPGSP
uniref:Uncharacterized protein LOC111101940 n=1 Tax=Crassostrea virginica TaxID=6565 RepID=A0A8B8AG06_CRAVI|nr:uncharacterized protein LOC111101940 [Crassostrea virginica]